VAPKVDSLVVHYHEVGLKGRNRDFFERTLARNVKRALRGTGYGKIRRVFGRLLVDLKPDALVDAAVERAGRVFGVANLGAGIKAAPDLDALERLAVELMTAEPFTTFAVRTRRTYSTLQVKSHDVNVRVGRAIQDATGAPVDLTNPSATCYIELFGARAIVYRARVEGPGGLPVGTGGRMLALLSGGIDSPVAAWRMALRGAEVELVHFHGQPYTDPSSVRQVKELAEVLARYQLRCVLHLVPLGEAQREIVMQAPSDLRTLLYRRAMLRIADALARDVNAGALVLGDSLGQVASQTLQNMRAVDAVVTGAIVLRPLVGWDKNEIITAARRIGTYEISTRPYQDCCVLFEPREPATKARPSDLDKAEAELDLDTLVGKALAGRETLVFELPDPR
jgi:thiamine biosynthesis protein ThiI